MKKLITKILPVLIALTAAVTVFAMSVSASEAIVPTAENLGTAFIPVKKNPFVTDKLDLTEGTFTDSDNWNGFTLESKYYDCGGGVVLYSPSAKCLFGLPLGTANVGVTFRAAKSGKMNIKVTAYKENDNGTEVRIGIGINGKHYGENDVTEPLTKEKTVRTFSYTVSEGDTVAIIVTLPNGGDGGNTFFMPEITFEEAEDGEKENPSTADFGFAAAAAAVMSLAVMVCRKKH